MLTKEEMQAVEEKGKEHRDINDFLESIGFVTSDRLNGDITNFISAEDDKEFQSTFGSELWKNSFFNQRLQFARNLDTKRYLIIGKGFMFDLSNKEFKESVAMIVHNRIEDQITYHKIIRDYLETGLGISI